MNYPGPRNLADGLMGDSPEHADLAEALGRACDTFEAIRQLARCCENL